MKFLRTLRRLSLLALVATGAQAMAATETVKVIAFNDFHGTLQSPGNFFGVPSGGADYVAGWVRKLKSENPNNIVVAAGDLIGASPLISAFYHDEGTIEALNRIGLEVNAVGNHEFDEGSAELLRMQNGGCHPTDPNTCKGDEIGGLVPDPFEGARFSFLSANVVSEATGKTLLAPFAIKTFANGRRVAFIGMTLKDTPTIVTPSGVAGLRFLDEATTVNALIPRLRARGVEAIVVLIHQGGFQGAAPNGINDCSANLQSDATSPIRGIVRRLDNAVDLVVSGHTHTGYICRLPNKTGRMIPVTQASAFGRVLTDIDMDLDTVTGDVVAVRATNRIVNRADATVVPSATLAGIVSGYASIVSPLANQVIGSIASPASNVANPAGEMLAGKLIADAQLTATTPVALGGALIAFMNAGGVRSPGFTAGPFPHDVTYQEAFTVQPFGNSLVTLTLTAQQIKNLLEQQFPGCLGQTTQRVMQISAGFQYSWSASAPACSKIVDVSLNGTPLVVSGVVQGPSDLYRVTVNNFMATGGDGFTVLLDGQGALGGAQDIDALIAYMAQFKSPNAPYDPATIPARITRLP